MKKWLSRVRSFFRRNFWQIVHIIVAAIASLGVASLSLWTLINFPLMLNYSEMSRQLKMVMWAAGVLVVLGAALAWWLICNRCWSKMFAYLRAWRKAAKYEPDEYVAKWRLLDETTDDVSETAVGALLLSTVGLFVMVVIAGIVLELVVGSNEMLLDALDVALPVLLKWSWCATPVIAGVELGLTVFGWLALMITARQHNQKVWKAQA